MSKLIGTNPNQVPSNADLGTAAFMDKKEFLLSKGSEMSAIEAVIPKTAVDVFIYDTTKDSDGGAWRKRVQHTSWYNERLNTTTRGSRKEFPCVAVIVAETAKVTIYDADDINMPMWMVLNGGNDVHMLGATPTAAVLKDGALWVSLSGYGVSEISFVKDEAWRHRNNVNSLYYGKFHGGIVDRNIDGTFSKSDYLPALVNGLCKDIAITVLPNAPIDSATGLPVPTIAVATAGGVSVIKDDGTVVDIVSSYLGHETPMQVKFVGDKVFWLGQNNYDDGWSSVFTAKIPGADLSVNYDSGAGSLTKYTSFEWSTASFRSTNGSDILIPIAMSSPRTSVLLEAGTNDELILGGKGADDHGTVVKIVENVSDPESGMLAQIASDFNTGYQVGDIKLATLSDTDTTNVTGTELVTNGTFSSNVTGWSTSNGSTIVWNGSGDQTATVTSNGVNVWNGATQTLTGLVVGKTYILTADIITSNNWGSISFSAGANSGVKYGTYTAWNGGSAFPMKAVAQFTASTTSVVVSIDSLNTTYTTVTKIDNISVHMSEEDRSVNNKGLQVFGTITKTPVMPGADLVGYSGWSASNYLRQPYNTALNFGTGSYSVMGWFKTDATNSTGVITQNGPSDADENLMVYIAPSTYGIYFDYGVSSEYAYLSQATDRALVADTTWHHFVCHVSAGGAPKIYVDGVDKALTVGGNAPSTFTFDTDYLLNIGTGRGTDNSIPFGGSIALLRISATVPSPEQIKKIYNDEKHLFQENAKCTLYGTSDAVTALAYDDDTELLHVGTSAGRSDFQGLRRINNTTRAIGTAISAVDGFIVEE